MITYQINGEEEQEIFMQSVNKATEQCNLQNKINTECDCPLCKKGKVMIVRSERIKGYMLAQCNYCGAGAFN